MRIFCPAIRRPPFLKVRYNYNLHYTTKADQLRPPLKRQTWQSHISARPLAFATSRSLFRREICEP